MGEKNKAVPVIVELTEEEIEVVRNLGEKIQSNHHSSDRDSLRLYSNVNHEHILGKIGEYAFEKWSGLKMDRNLRRGGDGGADFRPKIGDHIVTIDVKTTARPHASMLVRTDKQLADIYVFCTAVADFSQVIFWGVAERDLIKKKSIIDAPNNKLKSLGRKNYIIPREELRDMEDVLRKYVLEPAGQNTGEGNDV